MKEAWGNLPLLLDGMLAYWCGWYILGFWVAALVTAEARDVKCVGLTSRGIRGTTLRPSMAQASSVSAPLSLNHIQEELVKLKVITWKEHWKWSVLRVREHTVLQLCSASHHSQLYESQLYAFQVIFSLLQTNLQVVFFYLLSAPLELSELIQQLHRPQALQQLRINKVKIKSNHCKLTHSSQYLTALLFRRI